MHRPSFAAVPPLVLLLLAHAPVPAEAHRDDYIDETFVYTTPARGEFECELWGEVRGGRGWQPVDLAVSAEYERERLSPEGDFEQTLTPRIVASRDLLSRFNTTLNLDVPIALSDGNNASFAWALGVGYPDQGFARYGVELKQQASQHRAVAFPQIWFALPREMTLKLGAGIGLTPQSDPFVGRAVFEAEF
jgi:hypothetical protein